MYRVVLLVIIGSFFYQAKSQSLIRHIDEVKVSASNISDFELNNTTSVADYISKKQLKKFNFNDASKLLSTVNGVYVYEEDGFGLRPNISIRGTSGARSSKINLMEDGIPIAPAPYTASSAYYFPTMNRMSAIEILKGNSQIQYGPHTSGGAINMISTQIPDSFSFGLHSNIGSFNTINTIANIGLSKRYFGLLAEYAHNSSNGFKTIQGRENQNIGFDKNEILLKGQLNSDLSKEQHHILDAKFHFYDEVSNETYLGISRNDFERSPQMRYAASMNDVMNAEHYLYNLNYTFQINKNIKWKTSAYLNKFHRNWYKLNDVTLEGEKVSISDILNDTESYQSYYNVLNGTNTGDDDFLKLRANNRNYTSKGVQSKIELSYKLGNTEHKTEISTRVHYDDEDRFQWEDKVGMNQNTLFYIERGTHGTQSNKITSTQAWSSYLYHTMKIERLTLTGGLRYERIDGMVEDYGKSDTARLGDNISLKENQYGVFIPGIGFSYQLDKMFTAFGGVHRGFSPASVESDVDPELSTNYELGTKMKVKRASVQIVAFMNDYQNMLGSNQNAIGGGGTLEQYNAGDVLVKGLEFNVGKRFLLKNQTLIIPVNAGYTFTDAKFRKAFSSKNELWGEVSADDNLPFIASHQLFIDAGIEYKKFNFNVLSRYKSEMLTSASADYTEANTIPETWVVDMSLKYQLNQNVNLGLNVQNLFDNQNIVSNIPSGFRTMMPRFFGLNFEIKY